LGKKRGQICFLCHPAGIPEGAATGLAASVETFDAHCDITGGGASGMGRHSVRAGFKNSFLHFKAGQKVLYSYRLKF